MDDFEEGDCTSTGNMTPELKWMTDMGILYAEKVSEVFHGEYARFRAYDDVRRKVDKFLLDPVVYRFSVISLF
jgi:hypothetical protein